MYSKTFVLNNSFRFLQFQLRFERTNLERKSSQTSSCGPLFYRHLCLSFCKRFNSSKELSFSLSKSRRRMDASKAVEKKSSHLRWGDRDGATCDREWERRCERVRVCWERKRKETNFCQACKRDSVKGRLRREHGRRVSERERERERESGWTTTSLVRLPDLCWTLSLFCVEHNIDVAIVSLLAAARGESTILKQLFVLLKKLWKKTSFVERF